MSSEFDNNWVLSLEVGLVIATLFSLFLMLYIC